jgi:hypothetical protein
MKRTKNEMEFSFNRAARWCVKKPPESKSTANRQLQELNVDQSEINMFFHGPVSHGKDGGKTCLNSEFEL